MMREGFSMKYFKLIAMIIAGTLILSACGVTKDIAMTKSAEFYVGENYLTVEDELKDLGFTNVLTQELGNDKDKGKVGEVQSISINNNKDFQQNESFKSSDRIMIAYYGPYESDANDESSASINKDNGEASVEENSASDEVTHAGAENTGEVREIEMPSPSWEYEDQNVHLIVNGLEGLGFTDITVIPIPNTSGIQYEGMVTKLSINGNVDFWSGAVFPSDAKVAITYVGEYQDVDAVSDGSSN